MSTDGAAADEATADEVATASAGESGRGIWRAVAWGGSTSIAIFAFFGLVTGLLPNSLYVRMVPRTPVDYLFLTLTALLAGIYVFQRRRADACETDACTACADDDAGPNRLAFGGLLGGFFAVSCPVCNAIFLAFLSSSTIMTVVDPLRPVVGALSVAALGAVVYRRWDRSERRAPVDG